MPEPNYSTAPASGRKAAQTLTAQKRLVITLAAGFGGIAANLLALAVILLQNGGLPQPTYYLAMCILFIMGAAVALIWGETDARKAFYLGIGLPALLQVTIQNATAPSPKGLIAPSSLGFIIPSVSAQPVDIPKRSGDPTNAVHLGSTVLGSTGLNGTNAITKQDRFLIVLPNKRLPDYPLVVKSGAGEAEMLFKVDAQKTNIFRIPSTAKRIYIQDPAFESVERELPSGQTPVTIKVDAEKNVWSGFQRAFGAHNIKDYKLDIDVKK
jgi:hypothetical protein